MESLVQDLRYAVRQLWSARGVTLLAVLTLALGIGSNAALFTVVESILLRPLPYAQAELLTYIGPRLPEPGYASTSWLNYRDVRDQAHGFTTVAGYSLDSSVIEGPAGAQSVTAPHLTPNTFAMLGAKPMLGRTFLPAEGLAGGPQVVLLSEQLWRSSFGADRGIVGRAVKVGGRPYTVTGVMPDSFRFPDQQGTGIRTGLWLPLQPTAEMNKDRGYSFFSIVGKRRAGVTLAQAQAELDAVAERINRTKTGTTAVTLRAIPYQSLLTLAVRPAVSALVAALALVLLIACANVANLLIARCVGRRQEFAVRVALGASRYRLVRQLLTEGALLSLFGSLAGLAMAQFALSLIKKLPDDTIPRADSIAIHWPLLALLAAVATVTTILSSLLPALLAARADPQSALQAASRGIGARSGSGSLSRWLVVGEVALSTLLLVATGLLFHTLYNLQHAQLGFATRHVTTFSAMPADAAGFSNMAVSADTEHAPTSNAILTYAPVLQRLRQVAGVEAAALITAPPLAGIDMHTSFAVSGRAKNPADLQNARISAVSGSYAQTLSIATVRGRGITEQDGPGAPYVAVINQVFADRFFKGENPLGQQLDLGGKDTGMLKPYTIVGVLANQPDQAVSAAINPFILLPYEQVPTTSLFYQALLQTVVNFVVKTRADIPIAGQAQAIFHQLAPGYAVEDFKSMQQVVDESMFSQRLGLYLTCAFAALAVLMLVAGLYGVLAQLVSYRRREFGVRMALGASRQSLGRLVLRQGSVLIGTGLISGLVLALLLGNVVKSFLYGVQPVDGLTYAIVAVVSLAIGLLASLIPAHRAASIEPMEALRDD